MQLFLKQQIFDQAILRYGDGEILCSLSDSDSSYLLKLLGFELMLKLVLHLEKNLENTTHNYYAMYNTLSRNTKRELTAKVQEISEVFDIGQRIKTIYGFIFVQFRKS